MEKNPLNKKQEEILREYSHLRFIGHGRIKVIRELSKKYKKTYQEIKETVDDAMERISLAFLLERMPWVFPKEEIPKITARLYGSK